MNCICVEKGGYCGDFCSCHTRAPPGSFCANEEKSEKWHKPARKEILYVTEFISINIKRNKDLEPYVKNSRITGNMKERTIGFMKLFQTALQDAKLRAPNFTRTLDPNKSQQSTEKYYMDIVRAALALLGRGNAMSTSIGFNIYCS